MRSLMLAATLAVTSLVAQPDADACGGSYGPQAPVLFLVSGHHGTHNFVLLNQDVDVTAHAWRILNTDSYDRTSVAAAPVLATPVQLTLLGERGTKVVRTRSQILVQEGLSVDRKPTVALQVPTNESFMVATFGNHTDYTWEPIEHVESGLESEAWARSRGLAPETVSMNRAGETELLSYWNPKTNAYETQVKHRGWSLGTRAGHAIGAITANGIRYAVFANGNVLSTMSVDVATARPRG
jgi:hypothetical protein